MVTRDTRGEGRAQEEQVWGGWGLRLGLDPQAAGLACGPDTATRQHAGHV